MKGQSANHLQLFASCESLLTNDTSPVMVELRSRQYDVAIIHMVDSCAFGLAEMLKINATIWMSTAFMIEPMAYHAGAHFDTAFVPSSMHAVSQGMTLYERTKNTVISMLAHTVMDCVQAHFFTNLFRRVNGASFPSMRQLYARVQLFFINTDIFFEYARPTPPNVINVGGLTMMKAQPLAEEWQKIVDGADKGVVVFSMGSVANTSTMPLAWKVNDPFV